MRTVVAFVLTSTLVLINCSALPCVSDAKSVEALVEHAVGVMGNIVGEVKEGEEVFAADDRGDNMLNIIMAASLKLEPRRLLFSLILLMSWKYKYMFK